MDLIRSNVAVVSKHDGRTTIRLADQRGDFSWQPSCADYYQDVTIEFDDGVAGFEGTKREFACVRDNHLPFNRKLDEIEESEYSYEKVMKWNKFPWIKNHEELKFRTRWVMMKKMERKKIILIGSLDIEFASKVS